MLTDNVVATQALVRHALAAKASAFVFFSSISAFGTIRVPVLTETEPCVNVDAYGMTKLIGEKLLDESAGALPSLSIRLPAVIGRGSKRNWPSEALRKLKAGAPLDYLQSGRAVQQRRARARPCSAGHGGASARTWRSRHGACRRNWTDDDC